MASGFQNCYMDLTSEGMKQKENIDNGRQGDQSDQRRNCSNSVQTPTTQNPQFDLHQVHQRQSQEPTSQNRTQSRNQSPQPQGLEIDMNQRLIVTRSQHIINNSGGEIGSASNISGAVVREYDGLLDCQGDEAGEEERAEGVDVEDEEVLAGGRGSGAGWVGDERCGGAGDGLGEAEEEG
ncbi:unnamed protein product [Linum tenue]|uniref:Uncharacterized protein n=1 Tax=Linum tenue TaxID=586396 RepID=A0AAV0Q449_9ROSI|nr:unnamed protein product [Linum tenue]